MPSNFQFLSLHPERQNKGIFTELNRDTYLSRNVPHYNGRVRILSSHLSWIPEGVTIPDAWFAMTENGLEIRDSKNKVLHTISIWDVCRTDAFKGLLVMALKERVFSYKQRKLLGKYY